MLTTLRIKNLGLVEQVTLALEQGLNVITGETGAGKSMLMGALALLLGERADKTLVRAGEEACGSEGVFELKDPEEVNALLTECGLDPCEEGQLIIRRVVRAQGSGQIIVNDSPVTLQVLKRLGQLLVDMHGPHDHQSLLNVEAQLDILDAFGHLWKSRGAYEEAFDVVRNLEKERDEILGDDGENRSELVDLLRYRVKEIEEADLKVGEEEELLTEHNVVGHAQRILELSGQVVMAFTEGEGSAFDQMASTRAALDELARLMPEAQAWLEEATSVTERLQELSASLTSSADRIETDPSRLEWLDQRLALYQKLKKKYGPTVEEVLTTLEEANQRLQRLEGRDERLAGVERALEEAKVARAEQGEVLHVQRLEAAERLSSAITGALRDLGFERGSFEVGLETGEPRRSGADDIEFGFAPNVGEPMRPLRAIASSGEISRVMLATKAVLAEHDRIPVLVFDEIDANLGGEMGHAVGAKLAAVATTHQVLCITHLPQVAVFGTHHVAVRKDVQGGRTLSSIQSLDTEEERAREVARMLGGEEHTSVTLEHARALLQNIS